MKRFLVLFLAAVLLFCIAGCTGQTPDPSSDGSGDTSTIPSIDSTETVDVFPGGTVELPAERTPIAGSLYTPSKPESVAGGEALLEKYRILDYETCMLSFDEETGFAKPVYFQDASNDLSPEEIVLFFEFITDTLYDAEFGNQWYDSKTKLYYIPTESIQSVVLEYLGFDCTAKLQQLPVYDNSATVGNTPLYYAENDEIVLNLMGGFGGDGLFPVVSEVEREESLITLTVEYWDYNYINCSSVVYVVEDKGESFTYRSISNKTEESVEETYRIVQQNDGTYGIQFLDKNGELLKTVGAIARHPTVLRTGDMEYFVQYQPQAGSAANYGYFYSIKTGEFSKEYHNVLGVSGSFVACASAETASVIVHDRTTGTVYETKFFAETDPDSIHFFRVEFLHNAAAFLLEYQPAKLQDAVTEYFPLPGPLIPLTALQLVKSTVQDGAEQYDIYDGLYPYLDRGEFYAIRSSNAATVEGVYYGLTQFLYLVHSETGEIVTLDVMDEEQAIQLAKAAVGDVGYETFYECYLLCPGDSDFPQYPPYYRVQVRAPGFGTLATVGIYFFNACTGEVLEDPMKIS